MPAISPIRTPHSALRSRSTVFWKVAGVLVGVQVATALLAVFLSGYLARERALELVRGNLVLRLDQVAEEVESRAEFDTETGALTLPRRLRLDLATRFPDPAYVLDEAGTPSPVGEEGDVAVVPPEARAALEAGRIEVELREGGSWAVAPLLAPDGLPAGALYIRPLDATLAEEMRGTREAFVRATLLVSALAALVALLLGALFTGRLVRPLRRITRRVETLGEGAYADRLPEDRQDELGRLAVAINEMAGRVEASLDALRATDRLRRELVANVGHDLRTPLAALQGYLDEAARFAEAGRETEAAGAVAIARRQSEHVARLVADLFELSRLEQDALASDGAALRREPVPLAELLHEAARAHRPAFDAAGIAFDVAVPPGLPIIEADGARLLRVLDNLLSNARRHTPAGGLVRLAAEVDAGGVSVVVADTGEGIPEGEREAIFERYYRGGSARTREAGGGTGLGLAISRAIARAHGGDLTAASTDGPGSRFTLRLPRRRPAA